MNDLQVLEPDTQETEVEDNDEYAHIIDRGDDPRPPRIIVMEAALEGNPVHALCGKLFVPKNDPREREVCPKCLEMSGFARSFRS